MRICSRVAGTAVRVPVFILKSVGFGLDRLLAMLAGVLLVGISATAVAQGAYTVAGPSPMPYQPLSENAVAQPDRLKDKDWSYPTTQAQWDESQWVVPLPSDFTFRYWGETFTHVNIGGNGCVKGLNSLTPPSYSADYGCYYRTYAWGYTSSSYTKGMIAPWWADWARSAASPHPGGIFYEIVGEAPNRVMKIEWRNVNHYSCNNAAWPSGYSIAHCEQQRSFSFQLWISEASAGGNDNSTLLFSYGTPIGPPPENLPFGGEVTGYNFGYSTDANYYFGSTIGLGRPGSNTEYIVPEVFRSCAAQPTTAYYNYYGDCRPDRDWPAEQAIVFTEKAEIVVSSVTAPSVAWGGIPIEMRAVGMNIGSTDAPASRVHFFGSRDRVLDENDVFLGESASARPLLVNQPVEYTLVAALPLELEPSDTYYIIAKIDPNGVLNEALVGNNVAVSNPIVVGARTADLTVDSIEAPAEIELGERFTLTWTARNLGNLPVINVPYRVVLSKGSMISASDFLLHEGVVTVDMLATEDVFVETEMPEAILAGTYHIGVVLDPFSTVLELDKFNNAVAAPTTTLVFGELSVATPALPPAQLGAAYCRYLDARGGDGVYTWSHVDGELPPGIELQAVDGMGTGLCGTPSTIGTWDFTLRVESAGMTAEQAFELHVVESGAPLAVATGILPDARVLERYDAWLAAAGGRAPYAWTLVGGSLPLGLHLSADGQITGAPEEDGVFAFSLEVQDAAGTTARGEVELVVVPSTTIRCLTRRIPTQKLDERYDFQLRASGGTAPYTWRTLESRLLAAEADEGTTWVGDPPDGMTLSADGRVAGAPVKAGRYLWQVEVTGTEGGAGDRCAIEFEVTYDQNITITTVALATAYAGSPYEVDLEVVGGEGPYVWKVASGSRLPAGLELMEDGTLVGVLDLALLEGARERTFDFNLVVTDYRNRSTSMPYRLTLRAEREVWEEQAIGKPREVGGCSSAAGGTSAIALIGALGLLARRRRR